jgi:hypothetical protein
MEEQTTRIGLCRCGCGQQTSKADRTNPARRWIKGQPKRYVHGHNSRVQTRYVEIETGYGTACWIWQLATDPGGYGHDHRDGRDVLAHRAYFEDSVGPIPRGRQIDHLCRQRDCVNPNHLEVVTARENVRRGRATKLTQADVNAIRASNEKQHVLARRYGVTQSQISRIKNYRSWC